MEKTNERRRVRQRKPELMLQAALNDAEELSQAAPTLENVERMRLVKARLFLLKSRVNRELTRRVEELETENERLKHQHERDSAELARLRAVCKIETGVTFDEIATNVHKPRPAVVVEIEETLKKYGEGGPDARNV